MVVPPAAPMLITRNLLYTGITRAKKLLIIVGMEKVVDFMIQNVDVKKRITGLEYKLKNTTNWDFSFGSIFVKICRKVFRLNCQKNIDLQIKINYNVKYNFKEAKIC